MAHDAHHDHAAHDEHSHHIEDQPWLERYWPVLVILFGVICVLALDFWHPASSV